MALCKAAVSPLLMPWRCCSLALNHRYADICIPRQPRLSNVSTVDGRSFCLQFQSWTGTRKWNVLLWIAPNNLVPMFSIFPWFISALLSFLMQDCGIFRALMIDMPQSHSKHYELPMEKKVPWNGAVSMRSRAGSWETLSICITLRHNQGAPPDMHANALGILIICRFPLA